MVRFGLFFLPVGDSAEMLYRNIFAEAQLADELGYDHAWFAEHHWDRYGGVLPSASVVCAAVAAITKRIHMGPAIAVLPLHDPVQLAEQFAMVDVISNGRLEMGLGRGFMLHEFRRSGVAWESRDDSFDERLASLLQAWGMNGANGDAAVMPRPVQSPPPIWFAASLSQHSFEVAGENGFGLMINPYTRTREELDRGLGWYRAAWARGGRDPKNARLLVHSHLFVGEHEDEARNLPRQALLEYLGEVDRAFLIGQPESRAKIAAYDYDQMYPQKVMFGTPDFIEGRLREWIDRGATDFCFMTSFGSLDSELSRRTIRRFAESVVPRFA